MLRQEFRACLQTVALIRMRLVPSGSLYVYPSTKLREHPRGAQATEMSGIDTKGRKVTGEYEAISERGCRGEVLFHPSSIGVGSILIAPIRSDCGKSGQVRAVEELTA
jgi:hypothetical protein